jgi:hypothetical protein
MRPLPDREIDVDRRWVTRVPPYPHVRFDTNDDSQGVNSQPAPEGQFSTGPDSRRPVRVSPNRDFNGKPS